MSDDFDVESLRDTAAARSYRQAGVGPEVVREATRLGLRCVRVMHGKGNGSPGRRPVLNGKVQSWLVQKSGVLAFTQARASEGGAGALVVLLSGTASASPTSASSTRPGTLARSDAT